jgi:NAD(P)-dependent dehydrogenase (short-subunit alcohol dehydrogenase family)
MPALDGQTIVVTGAAQGLGAAIARHLHAKGARLILMDRDSAGLAAVAADCHDAVATVVDLADAADTARAIVEVVTVPVDTVVHNAAILKMEAVDVVSLATFQATLNVGIQAAFQLTRAVWPAMKTRGGTLVFVSSRSGIEGFAECLALEGAAHGILSVTVTPGMYMNTPMSETTYPLELRAKWVDPIRLAPAFAYLATRPLHLSGQRLDAWALSQEHPS